MHGVMLDSDRGKYKLEKTRNKGFLKGVLKNKGVLGASTTTPGNNWLLREFKVKIQRSMYSEVT